MAKVTALIVFVGVWPNRYRMVIDEINRYLAEQYPRHPAETVALVSLADSRLPEGWTGGPEEFPSSQLWIGGYNYLDLDGFLAHVRGLDWRPNETVQVFVHEQDDNGFRLIDLSPRATGTTRFGAIADDG